MYFNGPPATWFARWKTVKQEFHPAVLIWLEFLQARSSVCLPSTSCLIHPEELKAPSFLTYGQNVPRSVSLGPTLQQMGVADDTRSQTFSGSPPGAMPRDARYLLYVTITNSSLWNGSASPELQIYAMDCSPCRLELVDKIFDHTIWDILVSFPTLLYPHRHQFEKSTVNSRVVDGSFDGGLLQVVC